MTIEQKIFSKLEPHAKRISEGNGNDFDYLPAVLMQVMEGQKLQAKLLDDTAKFLTIFKSTTEDHSVKSTEQMAAFASSVGEEMTLAKAAVKDTNTELKNSHVALSEQIAVIASAHEANAMQIESLISFSKQAHVKYMRLLIAGLVASIAAVGLVVAVLQKH